MKHATPIAALAILLLTSACASKPQTYDLQVTNESPAMVLVWLTKTGGPLEAAWLSPEQVAAMAQRGERPAQLAGAIVQSGTTMQTQLSGTVPGNAKAVLRAYGRIDDPKDGQSILTQALSISRGSPNRTEVELRPGANVFVVREVEGKLVIFPK